MKKFLVFALTLFVATAAFAGTHTPQEANPPSFALDSGGPDAYGYRWIDSDGSGGPVYNWVDISTVGTPVTGLADDNNIGPIPMGFDFPYYWYNVNRLWIGSNGYISFSSNTNFAHPFDSIPAPPNPNDLIAVLGGDLDFTEQSTIRPPACYYYSNNVDSFVVSWINVSQFSANHGLRDSTHTFQLILTKADSTVTFQYGENHGNFNENGNLATIIGIENLVGRVGIEYLEDNLPSARMWHANLVVKFHPIPNPSFQFHDFGVLEGFNESSGAEFIPRGQAYRVRVLVKNFGLQAENNMTVRCQIRRQTTIIYNVLDTVAHLEASEQAWVEYDSMFTPGEISTYRVTFTTTLTGDQNTTNNSKTYELNSYTLPQVLRYSDDIGESGRSWNGDFSGFGVEFVVPEPVGITTVGFNVFDATTGGPAYVWVVPSDVNGNPDLNNILCQDTVQVNTDQTGWYDVDFTWANLTFDANEKFFVVALHALQSTFQFAMDTSVPLSYRGWEYTGGLGPDRDRQVSDVMFRANAISVSGVEEGNTPKVFSLGQNYPNPFNAQTNIRFTLDRESDVSIDIYNIAGQLVKNISGHYTAGANVVTWDASSISSGVYFYKLNVDGKAETRKMVLLK